MAWGSSYIDNLIAFGSTEVIHHGQDANRLEKMRYLTNYFEKVNLPTPFRVCYHQSNTKLNCSVCAKCYRAILTLILLGKDPRVYGFTMEMSSNSMEQYYDNLAEYIQKVVFRQSVYYYWLEIYEEMNTTNQAPFIFFNKVIETQKINELKSLLQQLKFKKKRWNNLIMEKLDHHRTKWFEILHSIQQ